jgi:hypothetical protein
MRFTSESVMHDIEVALRERKEMDWSNTDRLLLKAQLHIAGLQRHLQHRELTQDEILDIWYAMEDDSNNWTRYVDFARAILRKAQEK